jgi:hypothetical protein
MKLLALVLISLTLALIYGGLYAVRQYRRDIRNGWPWDAIRVELTPTGLRYVNPQTARIYTAAECDRLARAPVVWVGMSDKVRSETP